MPDLPPNVRTRILSAAFKLLSEHGVGELTQPRIARAAGVRTSHLTYYFPTRNDLLIEVARFTIEMLVAGFKANVASAPAKSSGVAQLFGDAVATKRIARLMLSLIIASEEDRAIKPALRALIANERAHIREVLSCAGISVGDDVIPICHATLVGAAVLNLARDDAASEKEARGIARFVVDETLLRSAKAPAARATRRPRKAPARK